MVALLTQLLRLDELRDDIVRSSRPRPAQFGHERRPRAVQLLPRLVDRSDLCERCISLLACFLFLNDQVAEQQKEDESNAKSDFGEGELKNLVVSLRHVPSLRSCGWLAHQ